MRKLILGVGAAALLAGVAFAAEPGADAGNTRLAAADAAKFSKLDTDQDGRVSAIEAAADSKVAAGFTRADTDKDGYLSQAEFANLGRSSSSMDESEGAPQPRSDTMTPESPPPQ